MSTKYYEGRREALESLGLRQKVQDTPAVNKFITGLSDRQRPVDQGGLGNRPLHRQAWGKSQQYATSDQDVSGGGVRL